MATYDHGVKFDHPSTNDGFVSHVARRGTEKTATVVIWFFLLGVVACVYEAITSAPLWLWLGLGAVLVLIAGLPAIAMVLQSIDHGLTRGQRARRRAESCHYNVTCPNCHASFFIRAGQANCPDCAHAIMVTASGRDGSVALGPEVD
jgi:Zn finger protein HypA/HybF involved in hydrogenase expression